MAQYSSPTIAGKRSLSRCQLCSWASSKRPHWYRRLQGVLLVHPISLSKPSLCHLYTSSDTRSVLSSYWSYRGARIKAIRLIWTPTIDRVISRLSHYGTALSFISQDTIADLPITKPRLDHRHAFKSLWPWTSRRFKDSRFDPHKIVVLKRCSIWHRSEVIQTMWKMIWAWSLSLLIPVCRLSLLAWHNVLEVELL